MKKFKPMVQEKKLVRNPGSTTKCENCIGILSGCSIYHDGKRNPKEKCGSYFFIKKDTNYRKQEEMLTKVLEATGKIFGSW